MGQFQECPQLPVSEPRVSHDIRVAADQHGRPAGFLLNQMSYIHCVVEFAQCDQDRSPVEIPNHVGQLSVMLTHNCDGVTLLTVGHDQGSIHLEVGPEKMSVLDAQPQRGAVHSAEPFPDHLVLPLGDDLVAEVVILTEMEQDGAQQRRHQGVKMG